MIRTELRSYQDEAVRAALPHDGFALFDEQRVGKCLEALAIVDHRKPEALIIICPAQAVLTWETQIEEHLLIDWDCEVFIVTYQEPVKNLELRKEWYKWSLGFQRAGGTLMVIADEAHYLKKPGSAQSRFARVLAKRARWKLALTGTPADKGYEQYWAVFDFIQKGAIFGTYESFKERYVVYEIKERKDGKQYPVIAGYAHTDELLEKIHGHSHRVTFNEARIAMGKQPVRAVRRKVYFDLNGKSRSVYEEMEHDLHVTIGELTIESTLPMTLLQKLQQICGGFLLHQSRMPGTRKRHRLVVPIGDEKITCLMQLLSGLQGKVVICCRFTHEIVAIQKKFDEFNWTHKEVSGKVRWDGKFDVDFVVLQVRSGLGFDLSESNTYVFYSWDHSYITFEQARFRIMSMKNTKQVNYYFLMARDTIEDDYYSAVAKKKDFAQLVLDRYREREL